MAQVLRLPCMARKGFNYERRTNGYVVAADTFHNLIEHKDCSSGGAQEALQAMFDKYERDGWKLEGRSMDMQFARRGGERVLISIVPLDPIKDQKSRHLNLGRL